MSLGQRGAIGAAIAIAYVLVVAATMRLTPGHVRPLYEGFTPPPPYEWVNPPPEFRAGNTKPRPTSGELSLTVDGSAAGAVNTDDAQLGLNLPAGAFPANTGDNSVGLQVTPLDPAALGPVPSDLVADGNAYRVEATYRPSKRPVTMTLATPGNVFLVAPEPPTALLFSADGTTWQRLPSQGTGNTTVIAASFDRLGYFLAALPPGKIAGKSSGTGRIVLIATLAADLALLLVFGPSIWRRVRRPAPVTRGRARPTGKSNRKRRRRR